MDTFTPPSLPSSPFAEAVRYLRSLGHAVVPAGVPGLTNVDHITDLTMMQLKDFARLKGWAG